jgi:hypothetical protein
MKSKMIIALLGLPALCVGCATSRSDSDEHLIREKQQLQQSADDRSLEQADPIGAVVYFVLGMAQHGDITWFGNSKPSPNTARGRVKTI